MGTFQMAFPVPKDIFKSGIIIQNPIPFVINYDHKKLLGNGTVTIDRDNFWCDIQIENIGLYLNLKKGERHPKISFQALAIKDDILTKCKLLAVSLNSNPKK